VAVCSRDRTADLARCLDSLRRLDPPALELLVIDNAPATSATEELVRGRHPAVRYVREPRPGLNWARNRAIEEARGAVIAFTDDDVIVDPGWVRAVAETFASDPDVMIVTGLVAPAELETGAQVLFEAHGGFGRGFHRRAYRVDVAAGERAAPQHGGAGRFGTGANMAFRRGLFESVGRFDPALDVGTPTNGAGDLEMFFRALKGGHTLVYEPAALVWHRHRRDYDQLRRQIRDDGVGLYAYFVRSALAYPDEALGLARIAQWWFRWWHLRRFFRSFVRPAEFPRDLIVAELFGVFSGLVRYFASRRQAARIAGGRLPPLRPNVKAVPRPSIARRDGAIAVRTVDLAAAMPDLDGLDDYGRVRVLVTHHDRALTEVELPCWGRTVPAWRLRDAVAPWLAAGALGRVAHDEERAPASSAPRSRALPARPELPPDVPVSIVVATCRRPEGLRTCLRALARQQTRRPLEVIVVDNDPRTDVTPALLREFPAAKLVREARPGSAYARNTGFLASRGDVIVTTDDDVTMPPGWLEELLAPFARPEVMAVTGLVCPESLDGRAERLFETYGGLGRGFAPVEADAGWLRASRFRAAPTWHLGATANAAFRASLLRDVGMLDEALAAGMPTGCAEDTDFFYRLLKRGHTLVYHPSAYVRHRHRRTMRELRGQIHAYSRGHVAYHLTRLMRDRDGRALVRLLLELPAAHLARTWDRIRGRSAYPLSLLALEVAGNLAGPWALWRSRRRVARLGPSERVRERTKVTEHDLLEPGPPIGDLGRYGRALVLVRAGRQPIGVVRLDLGLDENTLTPVRIEQAAERQLGSHPNAPGEGNRPRYPLSPINENPLSLRERGRGEGVRERGRGEGGPAPAEAHPAISVVVCTRDRPELLADCLAALTRLRYAEHEVVVVDNASRDGATARVVGGTPFRYVREDRPGLDWARRRGAHEARHDILAYVDDDVTVDPWWLHGIADAFSDPRVDVVTGLVLPAELETRAQRLFEDYSGMSKGMAPRMFRADAMTPDERLAIHELGVGANMAFRRAALARVGGFDTSLDVGTPARGGGDLDVLSRVLAAGSIVRYEPSAIAWHRHRRDMRELRRQIRDNGVAFGVYLIRVWRSGRAPGLTVARFGIWRWFGGYLMVRLLRGLLGRGELPLALVWEETRGSLEAPFAYRAARRHDRRLREGPFARPTEVST
jgi:GT2 family glycosyltransferase